MPSLTAGGPPVVMLVTLTAPPPAGSAETVVQLAPSSPLATLNVTSLAFTASNWSQPQAVAVSPGTAPLPAGQAIADFNITLSWQAAAPDGKPGERSPLPADCK